jgi:hypothetical protein
MATYREIQALVCREHGFTVKTCWIAHVKELVGIQTRTAPNRHGPARVHPCPPDKRASIEEAMRKLGMLP